MYIFQSDKIGLNPSNFFKPIMTYFKINLVLFTNLNWGQMVGNIKKRLGTLWSENFPLCRALICAH